MQLPEKELDEMSAEDLVLTCVNFPLFGYFTAFNTPQEGFNIMFTRFNIFKKICEKDSTGHYLIKIYKNAGLNGWKQRIYKLEEKYWTLKLSYLEFLISQNEVISRLDKHEKIELLLIAKTNFNQKIVHESFNSFAGISSTLLLIAKILNSEKALDDLELESKKSIQYFFETGLLNSPEIIDKILISTELYLNGSKF